MFYGFEHRYGGNMQDADGERIGTLHTFPTMGARRAWIAEGPGFVGDSGWREVVSSSDPQVRKVMALPEHEREALIVRHGGMK